jgi:hypothetical protein
MVANCLHVISLSRIASGRCCPVVRTDVGCLPNPCLQRKAGIFLNFEERLDGCTIELTSRQMQHVQMHSRAIHKLLDIDGLPDALLGRPESELESAQNFPRTLK